MKKVYLTFTIVSAMGLLIFFGCSKEDNQTTEKQESVFQPTEKDLQIESKILAFKEKVEFVRKNPNLKSGGDDLSVEEAVWNIEALANYTYGDASTEFVEYIVDSCELVIPISDGTIEILDIQVAYDQMINTLSGQIAQIPETDKHMVVNDVSLKETDDNTVTFAVTTGYGIEGAAGSGPGADPTDYWYWGWDLGKCDGSGLGVGTDAADKIERWANMNIAVPVNSYYEDVSYQEVYPIDVPTTGAPYGDYMLFYEYQPGNIADHPCLAPNEMNYYFHALESIGIMYKPANKSIISYEVIDDFMAGIGYWVWAHRTNVKYGVWHTNPNPPHEL